MRLAEDDDRPGPLTKLLRQALRIQRSERANARFAVAAVPDRQILQAYTLKILHEHGRSIDLLDKFFGNRVAKERYAAFLLPKRAQHAAHGVTALRDQESIGRDGGGLLEGHIGAPLGEQRAKPCEGHRTIRVQLQARALEILHNQAILGQLLRDRFTEDRRSPIRVIKCLERSGQVMPGILNIA